MFVDEHLRPGFEKVFERAFLFSSFCVVGCFRS